MKHTLCRSIPDWRIIEYIQLPACLEDICICIPKTFASVEHRLFHELIPLIQLSEHDGDARKDGDPEDVGLAEQQAHQAKHEKPQMPPDLLDLTFIRTDQRIEAQQDRKRGCNVGIVKSRKEEQRR